MVFGDVLRCLVWLSFAVFGDVGWSSVSGILAWSILAALAQFVTAETPKHTMCRLGILQRYHACSGV